MSIIIHTLAGLGLLTVIAGAVWLLFIRKQLLKAQAHAQLDETHASAVACNHADPIAYVREAAVIEGKLGQLSGALIRCDRADAKVHAAEIQALTSKL